MSHLFQGLGVDDVPRLVRQRCMQRHEIRPPEQLVELDFLYADLPRPVLRQERVIGDGLHAQAARSVRDDGTDIATADDPQRLVEKLDAHEAVLLPFARLCRAVGFRYAPGERHHHRNCVLGRGHGIAIGRVHDDDPARGRRAKIDVVDSDAGASDDSEAHRLFDELRRYLGGGSHRQPIEAAYGGLQRRLVRTELRFIGHVDPPPLENFDSGLA